MRKQNWPQLLDDVINAAKEVPFEWGVSDCLQFSMQAAQTLIDRDIVTQFNDRNDYSTEEEGAELLETYFSGSYENIFNEVFLPVESYRQAMRGDIALVNVAGRSVCAIVDGSGRFAVCKTIDGIVFIPLRLATNIWRVE